MKKISKKLLIAIIAMLVLSATAFAAISFSLADESDGGVNTSVYAASEMSCMIDYIIENSKKVADPNNPSIDPVYHILELGSSDTPSDLKNLVSTEQNKLTQNLSDGFRQYVINENKSEGYSEIMTEDAKIEYIYYNATEGHLKRINNDGTVETNISAADIVDAINKADLCYLSNDYTNNGANMFKAGNDIPEEVKIALSTYATGKHKPLIIDSHNLTQQYLQNTVMTMSTVATNDFANYGATKCTYKWPDDKDAAAFFDLSDMSSLFLPVNGRTAKANTWIKLKEDSAPSVNDGVYVAKVLTVQYGSSDNALTQKVKAGLGGAFTNPSDSLDPTFDTTETYELLNTSALYGGYVGRYGTPTAVKFESVDLSTAQGIADLGNPAVYDLNSYDFVIIESGTGSVVLTGNNATYNALISAMDSRVHILYSKSLITGITSGHTTSDASNYNYVYDKVATSSDIRRFDYILVSTRLKMSSYSVATNGRGVKDIADIINQGDFRNNHGFGSDSSANVYTALEIEPCYPINTDLADIFVDKSYTDGTTPVKKFQDPQSEYKGETKAFDVNSNRTDTQYFKDDGFYYLRTDGVLDLTSDEISYNGNTSLTTMLENDDFEGSLTQDNAANIVDYYNWRLSKAKVAHALGVKYDEVRVVHMSSAEFAASKDTLLDNYDMIYVGGDVSSQTSVDKLYSTKLGVKYYNMYRHNGNIYEYPTNMNGYLANTKGVLTGNDITDDKLKELKEYVTAGMPVIFDDDVSKAFSNGTDIDPDSNMYDFISYASGSSFVGLNVLWGFDHNYTMKVANFDGDYGNTFSGYATVFAVNSTGKTPDVDATLFADYTPRAEGEVICESELSPLIQGKKRPRLAVTEMPLSYIEGNKSTWLTNTTLSFKYRVNGVASGTAKLYIDDDGNNRFTSDEWRKDGADGELVYSLPADYYGVVYWKLMVEDASGCSASTTGVCKIKRKPEQEKMVVDLLEIMPPMEMKENNNETLCFCYECQMSRGIFKGNRSAEVGKYSFDAVQNLASGFRDRTRDNNMYVDNGSSYDYDTMVSKIAADPVNKFDRTTDSGVDETQETAINNFVKYSKDNSNNNNLGAHNHKFGIVKYFENYEIDGKKGQDDWTTNWYDEIKEDYDVNLTMMTTREYENAVTLVNSLYEGKTDAQVKIIKDEFGTRRKEYGTYYKVMRELINGHYDATYAASNGSQQPYVTAEEKAAFETFLTSATTDPSNPGLGFTAADITAFGEAYQKLDNYLLQKNSADEYIIAQSIASKNTTSYDFCVKEILFETSKEINPDERSYYDLYSLANSKGGIESTYDEYSKLYQVWRNAVMLEVYFKYQYVKYGLLSSVNTEGSYKGKINLEDTFNCIVIGAAEDFNNDDLADYACYPLVDYVEDEGNLILFHDSLTSTKNSTANMTKILSDCFGQNARHLEYTNTDSIAVENIISVNVAGRTKRISFRPTDDNIKIKATAGTTKVADQVIKLVGKLQNPPYQATSKDITIPKDVSEANIRFYCNNNGTFFDEYDFTVVSRTNDDSAHEMKLNIELWIANSYADANSQNGWHQAVNPSNFAPYQDLNVYVNDILNSQFGGSTRATTIQNGSVSGFTFGNPTVTAYSGTDAEHTQTLEVTYVDRSGNPIANSSVVATNISDGSVVTATTDAAGVATFTFNNTSSSVTNSTGVRAKAGYRNSEYYLSPTLNNITPNTYTLTLRSAYLGMKGHSEDQWVLPFKYTWVDSNAEDAEWNLHTSHDLRDSIHSAVRTVSDKTTQTNKGIVTMYPFTIGSKMKISNTTSQSYALDIEDPNMTVFYTIAGGTSGTISALYAADPHNGQENYFLYQYGNITYTGAGHSVVTGYGRDNNDERRLFINCIVNSARKSTLEPDLKLYDVDSDMSQRDESGNITGLWNDYVIPISDGDADYKYVIEDINDKVHFSFLPTMTPGSNFKEVKIWYDTSRDGSNKNTYQDTSDVLVYKSGKNDYNDSGILTRITTGVLAADNRLGLYLSTEDPGLLVDPSNGNNPYLLLRDSYFDTSKRAYIVVQVNDDKLGEAKKVIRIEYKPELLDLN